MRAPLRFRLARLYARHLSDRWQAVLRRWLSPVARLVADGPRLFQAARPAGRPPRLRLGVLALEGRELFNSAPVIVAPATVSYAEGQLISPITIGLTDADNDPVSMSGYGPLPPGLTYDAATRTISGRVGYDAVPDPGMGSMGMFTLTLEANDGFNPPVWHSIVFNVTDTNRLTDPGTQNVDEGQVVDVQLAANDAAGNPLTYGVGGSPWSDLPAGLSLDAATGRITGTVSYDAATPRPLGIVTTRLTVTGGGATDSRDVTWNVTDTNRLPVITGADDRTNAQDDTVSTTLVVTDPDDEMVMPSVTGLPDGLMFDSMGNIGGTVTAQPGTYTVTVTATDGYMGTTTRSFTWTITPVNHAPTLMVAPDTLTVTEGSTASFSATGSDPDVGQTLTYSLVGAPPGATIDAGSGAFTWDTIEADGPGTYTFTVKVTDSGSPALSATAPVTITVTEMNQMPTAVDDAATVAEDGGPVTVAVLDNDTDPDLPANPLTVTGVGTATSGTVTYTATGVTYTPNANFHGTDSFTYTISDGQGGTATATVTVTVTAVNDPPDAVDDAATTDEDTPVTVPVLTNDTDPDGDPLTVTAYTQGMHGTVSESGGSLTYTPNANFHGTDSFTYTISDGHGSTDTATVTITVNPVNDPPTLDPIGPVTVDEGQTASFTASATDPDQPFQPLTFSLDGSVPPGAAIDPMSGAFSWTPGEADGPGTYTFQVVVSDGNGGTATQEVNITVTEVNDPPTVTVPAQPVVTPEDTPVVIPLSVSDPDAGSGEIEVTLTATHGTLAVAGGGAVGNGTGEVTLRGSLADVNAALATVQFTPDPDYFGEAVVAVTVDDLGNSGTGGPLCDYGTVAITVTPVNDPPVAIDDDITVAEDEEYAGYLQANDPDGPARVFTVLTPPEHGTLTVAADGYFTYQPDEDYNGSDGFAFQVSDGTLSDVGWVSITVTPVDDDPVAEDDEFVLDPQGVVSGSVALNDSDPDGAVPPLVFTVVSGPAHGALVLYEDGTFDYVQDEDFNGEDSFVYKATDHTGRFDEALVRLRRPNAPPENTLPAGPLEVDEDGSLTVPVSVADPDAGYEPLQVTLTATHGTLSLDDAGLTVTAGGTGTASVTVRGTLSALNAALAGLTFTPDLNYWGSASVRVETDDLGHSGAGGSQTDDDTVDIYVNPVNDPPVFLSTVSDQADAEGVPITPVSAGVATDPDLPNDVLTYSAVGLPDGLAIDPQSGQISGTIAYTAVGAAGDTFAVTVFVTDQWGASDSITFDWVVTNTVTVSFTAAAVGVGEDDGPALVTVVLSEASADWVTVDYSFTPGTATAGVDYPGGGGTVSFAPGELTQTIFVPVSADATYEADETLTVSLANPSGAHLFGITEAVVTILNDDDPPILVVGSIQVIEGDTGLSSLSYTVYLVGDTDLPVTARYFTQDGTATAAGNSMAGELDYIPAGGLLFFAPGVTEQTVVVSAIGDPYHEFDETVLLWLADPVNAVTDGAPGTGTILNNDPVPTVGFAVNAISVTEGMTVVVLTVSLSVTAGKTVTVEYQSADGTATAADYLGVSGTLTFQPGEQSKYIPVLAYADGVAEPAETYTVTLSQPDNASLQSDPTAVVTILDAPVLPRVSVTAQDPSAVEDPADPATFVVTRTGPTTAALTVYFTVGGSADEGADYAPVGVAVVIPAGQASATVTIDPVADGVQEPTEDVVLTLTPNAAYALDTATATATIADTTVTIAATVPDALEPGPVNGRFTVTRSGSTADDLTVHYTVSGTATPGDDYEPLAGWVVIPAGQASATFDVVPVGDDLAEADETVIVTLNTGGGAVSSSVSNPYQAVTATVTISDGRVSVTATDPAAAEQGLDPGVFTVTRTGSTASALTVHYTVTGTALTAIDFAPLSGSVVIEAGQSSATVHLTPFDDAQVEGPETVVLTILDDPGYAVGTASATVTIVDNDMLGELLVRRLTWDPLDGRALEQTGNVSVSYGLDLDSGPDTAASFNPRLVYNSDFVDVRPVFQVSFTVPPDRLVPPTSVTGTLTWDGVAQTFAVPVAGLLPGQTVTFAVQVAAPVAQTGRYAWSIELTADYPDPYGDFVAAASGLEFAVVLQDAPVGPHHSLGAGWSFSLADRLYEIAAGPNGEAGGLLRVFGTGGWRFYQEAVGGGYLSPAGDNGLMQAALGGIVYGTPDGQTWAFNAAGMLVGWSNADGSASYSLAYADADADGEVDDVVAMTAADGTVSNWYYTAGRLSSVNPPTRMYVLGYAGDLLETVATPGRWTVTYGYSGDGRLVAASDGGATRGFDYNAAGGAMVVSAGGLSVTNVTPANLTGFAVPALGATVAAAVGTAAGVQAWYLDDRGRALAHVDPAGGTQVWGRGGNGWVMSYRDQRGNTTVYQRDTFGYVTREILPDLTDRNYRYDHPLHRLTWFRDENGHATTYGYDALGRLETVTDPLNRTTTTTYYASGLVQSVEAPNGSVTAYWYDALRRPTTVIEAYGTPLARSVVTTYDLLTGEVASVRDPRGVYTLYAYDLGGRLRTVTAGSNTATPMVTTTVFDGAGRLASVTAPGGLTTAYAYDTAGRRTHVTEGANLAPAFWRVAETWYDSADRVVYSIDPLGRWTVYTYDAAARMVAVTEAAGTADQRTTAAGTDAAGNVAWAVDGRGAVTLYQADARNRPWLTTEGWGAYDPLTGLALARTTVTLFDGAGNLGAVTDPLGRTTGYLYDAAGQLRFVTEAVGTADQRVTEYEYTAVGQVQTVTAGAGTAHPRVVTTRYEYDLLGRRTVTLEAYGTPDVRRTDYQYDANDNLVRVTAGQTLTHPKPTVTTYAYDGLNRVTDVREGVGTGQERVTRYGYDAAGNVGRVTAPDGSLTLTFYTAFDQPYLTIGAANSLIPRATAAGYDRLGRLTWSQDAGGVRTVYEYDHLDRVVLVTEGVNPANPNPFSAGYARRATRFGYDAGDNVVLAVDPRGTRTVYAYDALGRNYRTTEAVGTAAQRSMETAYDLADRVRFVTTGLSPNPLYAHPSSTWYDYDDLDRVTGVTEGFGTAAQRTTDYVYNALDWVINTIDPLGRTSTFEYDRLGRRTRVQGPAGGPTQAVYDGMDNLVRTIDAQHRVTTTEYDGLSRAAEVHDAAGGVTATRYDAAGRVTRVTDAAGNQTRFEYDARGRLWKETDPLGRVTTYEYTARDQVWRVTDARGRVTEYGYDDRGRRTSETWSAGANSITYEYDANDNLTLAADAAGTYEFTYDELNRVTGEDQPHGVWLLSGYDAAGNRVWMSDSFGEETESGYDAVGQLRWREVIGSVRVEIDYSADGRVEEIRRYSPGGGLVGTTAYGYDAGGRLTSLTHGFDGWGSETVLGYDTLNRLVTETVDGQTTTYQYDATDQVTDDGANHLTYDAAGNRTGGGYNTTTGNQLQTDGVWTYAYDANGNLVSKVAVAGGESWTYQYDHRNRLTRAEHHRIGLEVDWVAYTYDVFDRRTERRQGTGAVGATVERYAYAGANVFADLDGSNNLTVRRVYLDGADRLVARVEATGAVGWYATDRFGSVVAVLDGAGAVLTETDYDAFGNVLTQTGSAAADRYGYTGREVDAFTGLQYNRARWYDPTTGRWVSRDPIGFAAGDPNTYRYVGNNTTAYTDPSGLEGELLHDIPVTPGVIEQMRRDGLLAVEPKRLSAIEVLERNAMRRRLENLDRLPPLVRMNVQIEIAAWQLRRTGSSPLGAAALATSDVIRGELLGAAVQVAPYAGGTFAAAASATEMVAGAFMFSTNPVAGGLLIAHGADNLIAAVGGLFGYDGRSMTAKAGIWVTGNETAGEILNAAIPFGIAGGSLLVRGVKSFLAPAGGNLAGAGSARSNRWWFVQTDPVAPIGPARFGPAYRNVWRDNPSMPAFSPMTGPHAGQIGVRPDLPANVRAFWFTHEEGHALLTNGLRFEPLQAGRQALYNNSNLWCYAEEAMVQGRAVYVHTGSLRQAVGDGLRYPLHAVTGAGTPYVTWKGLAIEGSIIIAIPVTAGVIDEALK